VHASIEGKHKRPGFKPKRQNIVMEFFSGIAASHALGWVRKERRIDRALDRYHERIELLDGTIVHNTDEPLNKHIGHGSDKPRK
jgi:hypothetical protein